LRSGPVGNRRGIELTDHHREILRTIGVEGASPELLRLHTRAREFDDLRHGKLVVFWPRGRPRPVEAVGCRYPGSWCLTSSGLAASRIYPPLRLLGDC